MDEIEFALYLARALEEYADEKVAAGNWRPEGALERAEDDFHNLLPDGLATPKYHLYTVRADGRAIGIIWFAEVTSGPHPTAFIYDFWIDESQRQKGYGRETLAALETEVRAHGLSALSLHVFRHNHAALALYQAIGFEITNINMTKVLGG